MPNLADDDQNWQPIFNTWAEQVYQGSQAINLPAYFKTAQLLAQRLQQGVSTDYTPASPQNTLAAGLRSNLYAFSGAKNFFETRLMAALITDTDGNKKPFKQYLSDVQGINKTYNQRYLRAEYQHAIAAAQSGIRWRNFETLGTEYLEYSTVGDERVRKSHAALDGLVLHINSPVWNRINPPNDWGCRCTVVPANKPTSIMPDADAGKLGKAAVPSGMFSTNVGKTELVFNQGHPYFKGLAGKLHQLDAEKHYGLKPMATIMANATNLPTPVSIDQYNNWWETMATNHPVPGQPQNFALTDQFGMKVLFDQTESGKKHTDYFHGHILRKKEGRELLSANIPDILASPNEVWTKGQGEAQEWHYIKYYADGPYLLTVLRKNGAPTAETFYKIDKDRFADAQKRNIRSGVLLHKKSA